MATLSTLSDESLMQEVAEGNLDSMTILFERYHEWIYNFLFQMIKDESICEDIMQTVFYKAICYRKSYRGGKFSSWIFKIARNCSSDYFSKEKKKYSTVKIEEVPDLAVVDNVDADQVTKLHYVINRLPVAEKELLVMSKFQGMKYQQIASIVGSTENAVKTKIHRTIIKLRTLYFETA